MEGLVGGIPCSDFGSFQGRQPAKVRFSSCDSMQQIKSLVNQPMFLRKKHSSRTLEKKNEEGDDQCCNATSDGGGVTSPEPASVQGGEANRQANRRSPGVSSRTSSPSLAYDSGTEQMSRRDQSFSSLGPLQKAEDPMSTSTPSRGLNLTHRPHSLGARLNLGGLEDSGSSSGAGGANPRRQSGSSDEKQSPSSGAATPSSVKTPSTPVTNGVNSKNGKKKTGNNWFNSSYKQKTDDFRKYFKDIPSEEHLLADYSCALQKDILVHGRLYVTHNWFCFYANIFGWETVVKIQCCDVTAITKEKTARVIPNAIQIATAKDRYFFSSFATRDKTFLMTFRVWQNALLSEPHSSSQLWSYARHIYNLAPSEDWDSTVEPEEAFSPSNDESDRLLPVSAATPGAGSPRNASIDRELDGESFSSDVSSTSSSTEANLEVQCPEHEHKGRTMVDDVYEFSADKAFEMMFTDNPFMRKFYEHRKTFDLVLPSWPEEFDSKSQKARQLTFTVTLMGFSFGPKTSPCVENQTVEETSFKPAEYMCVDTEALNDPNLPYGENFYIHNRYCISRRTHHSCRIVCHTEIVYKKSVFSLVRSVIEKNVWNGLTSYFKDLNQFLREASDSAPMPPLPVTAGFQEAKRKKTVHSRRKPPPDHKPSSVSPVSSHTSIKRTTEVPTTPGTSHNSSVKIISVVLLCLVAFNLLLFCKLWSHESSIATLAQSALHKSPSGGGSITHEELMEMLSKQQEFYDREVDRWKGLLDSAGETIQEMRVTIQAFQAAAVQEGSKRVLLQGTEDL